MNCETDAVCVPREDSQHDYSRQQPQNNLLHADDHCKYPTRCSYFTESRYEKSKQDLWIPKLVQNSLFSYKVHSIISPSCHQECTNRV